MTETESAQEVLFERRGQLGHILLNRPKAINALTHGMVRDVTAQLLEWQSDPAVATVLITGNGDRGLCAGGDIVGLYRAATEGDPDAASRFWADEYRMNALIASYPKPYIAVQDGIVLGGGIGISAHGSHRIVTERSSLGLPEVGIGFVPDVGSTWLLSRSPGELGTHVALTAGSVGAADAILLGLSDAMVPSDRLAELTLALESEDPDAVIPRFAEAAPAGSLAGDRGWIDSAYSGDDVRDILERLDGTDAGNARRAADAIRGHSPTALAVTLASLRSAATQPTLAAVLEQEFRVSMHALASHDFAEGVRAQVIDKDRTPRWDPADLPGPDDPRVTAYFENIPQGGVT